MKLRLNILLFLLSLQLCAQFPIAFDSLDANNLKIVLNSDGQIHRNHDGTYVTEIPKESGKTTVYAQQLWFGGVDEADILRIAASTYKQTGKDFWPGPVADSYTGSYDSTYNKVWHLKKIDIDNHINNYNTTGYIVPNDIMDWPGNGDVANGEAQNLAPYFDLNENDIYEPELGDYPLIRGDEALFVIYNDMKNDHTESGGEKVGVEIHHMLYTLSSINTYYTEHSYFSHYNIYNRGDHSYNDFMIGNWIDFDLGNSQDDYIQTGVDRNLVLVYNGDSIDEGNTGYGSPPPAYGCAQLNQDLDYSMAYENSNDQINGNPITPEDYKNYMLAKFKNGDNLINLDGNISPHIYPSNSVEDTLVWDEETLENTPGERRVVGTTVVSDFTPGSSICLDYASSFSEGFFLTTTDQIGGVEYLIDEVLFLYYDLYPVCSSFSSLNIENDIEINGNQISLINDNGLLYLTSENIFEEDINLDIYDVLGRSRDKLKLNSNTNEQLISTDKLTRGMYFITLTHNNERQSIKFSVY